MAYQYEQYQQQPPYGGSAENKTTLWMGELEPWMDESYIRQIWYQLGENVNVKFIRDKFTGANAGYCFVDFVSNAAAVKALNTVNGTPIPGTNRLFKLNWASGGGLTDRNRDDRGPEFSIFVGDLGPEVNEWMLVSVFQQRYTTCKSAKIMTDPMTGMSRGYGFVRFGEESEQQRALVEMQGAFCGNRQMRISTATPKNKIGLQGNFYQQPTQPNPVLNQYNDPNNTTVFVGGLSGVNSEEELRSYFQGFGEITYVKIPPGKGCGFVQFVHRQSAEMAINQMQHYPIGNSRVRLSWGRSQTDKTTVGPYRGPQQTSPYNPLGGMASTTGYGAYAPSTPVSTTPVTPVQPSSSTSLVDSLEPIPVQRMNEIFISSKEAIIDRMESESNWIGIYAQ
ncbi:10906_t:CDS:2 [Funneliformis geosporum]|uniref:478_t:CDS:1 n=1 Tax=Funneliformis geosporum TaxID=1117311 RepID=A0A9W4SC96_9GLOM|nr:10906_t:CDS:2 [Funneliformis geosporum]CAI2164468.1 478_t:CDS:2 [Funneliformis geosporum]